MKGRIKEIKPGIGLGRLKFGMLRTDVKMLLGAPSFVDKYSHSNSTSDLTESWEYEDLELSLSFDEEEDWKLTMISVTSNFYELDGISLIKSKENVVVEKLESLKIGELYLEDCSETDDEDQKVIEIDEKSINFWFANGILDEIQLSPMFIDDDTINWPK